MKSLEFFFRLTCEDPTKRNMCQAIIGYWELEHVPRDIIAAMLLNNVLFLLEVIRLEFLFLFASV